MKDKTVLMSTVSSLTKFLDLNKLSDHEKTIFILFFSQSYVLFSSADILSKFSDSIEFMFSLEPKDLIFCCYVILSSSWKPFYNILWESLILYIHKNWEQNKSLFVRFIGFVFSDKCSFLQYSMPRLKDGRFKLSLFSSNGNFGLESMMCKFLKFSPSLCGKEKEVFHQY